MGKKSLQVQYIIWWQPLLDNGVKQPQLKQGVKDCMSDKFLHFLYCNVFFFIWNLSIMNIRLWKICIKKKSSFSQTCVQYEVWGTRMTGTVWHKSVQGHVEFNSKPKPQFSEQWSRRLLPGSCGKASFWQRNSSHYLNKVQFDLKIDPFVSNIRFFLPVQYSTMYHRSEVFLVRTVV
jgi:hypothetical protein